MKGFFQAPWRFAACYAAFLIAAFTWALLDTFVIPHRELIVSRARDVADEVLETLVPSATLAAPQAAGASFYQDESMSVQLTTLRRDGTTCYVADVRLASPALLRTALAENTFGRNVTDTVSELAVQTARCWPSTATFMVRAKAAGASETGCSTGAPRPPRPLSCCW